MKRSLLALLFVCAILGSHFPVLSSITALFSPDDHVAEKFVEYINHEQCSIDIAIYALTNKDIIRALVNAYQRKVNVNVVIDEFSLNANPGYDAVGQLMNHGIAVYLFNPKQFFNGGSGNAQLFYNQYPELSQYYQFGKAHILPGTKQQLTIRPLMHHKFCLFEKNIDDHAIVWTGSFNFTFSGTRYNQENVLVISDVQTYDMFKKQFEIIRRERSALLTPYPMSGIRNGVCELLFTPDQLVVDRLIDLIDQEQQQIDVAIYSLSHNGIIDAIARACERGVTVNMILDHGNKSKFAGLGVNVYMFDKSNYHAGYGTRSEEMPEIRSGSHSIMHNKFCIFHKNKDNRTLLWTGSMNFTPSSTYVCQNNVLVIDDRSVIKQFANQFALIRDNRTSRYEGLVKKLSKKMRDKIFKK